MVSAGWTRVLLNSSIGVVFSEEDRCEMTVTRRWRIQRIIKDGKVVWEKETQEIIEPAVRLEIEIPQIDIDRIFAEAFAPLKELEEGLEKAFLVFETKPALPEKKGILTRLKEALK